MQICSKTDFLYNYYSICDRINKFVIFTLEWIFNEQRISTYKKIYTYAVIHCNTR